METFGCVIQRAAASAVVRDFLLKLYFKIANQGGVLSHRNGKHRNNLGLA